MELIRRTHGGATPVMQIETPHHFKEELHRAEKAAIGQAMAERTLEGQTVLLDGGTTNLEMARCLNQQRVTVVTNDLRMHSKSRGNAHPMSFIGGKPLPLPLLLLLLLLLLLQNAYTMWGPTSGQRLGNLRVDVAVFGAETVLEHGAGCTTPTATSSS